MELRLHGGCLNWMLYLMAGAAIYAVRCISKDLPKTKGPDLLVQALKKLRAHSLQYI